MNRSTNHLPGALWAAVVLGFASGCGGGDSGGGASEEKEIVAPGDTLVYQSRGSLQCGPAGLTPEQGAQRLINGGIDVLESGCGAMTGVAFQAVCGAQDGSILLHEIRKENLADAENLGVRSVTELRNKDGAGYVWVNCETGQTLP